MARSPLYPVPSPTLRDIRQQIAQLVGPLTTEAAPPAEGRIFKLAGEGGGLAGVSRGLVAITSDPEMKDMNNVDR